MDTTRQYFILNITIFLNSMKAVEFRNNTKKIIEQNI